MATPILQRFDVNNGQKPAGTLRGDGTSFSMACSSRNLSAQRFSTLQPPHSPRQKPLVLAVLLVIVLFCGCYRNTFGSDYDTCEEVNAEMKEELAHLQACSVDADCGLILEGTSCGCSNELVAHKEYDTARFQGLQQRAQELKCNATTSDCSCPETNGFVCTNGVCGWNYVK